MHDSLSIEITPKKLFEKGKQMVQSAEDGGITVILEAKSKAEAEESYVLAGDCYIYLSRYYRFQGQVFKSMEFLNKAYRLLNQYFPDDRPRLANIYKEYGGVYSDGFEDSTTGLNYSLKSLKLNIKELKPSLYNNIGCQYINLKKYDKALSFLLQGEQICKEGKDFGTLCFVYENFGQLFQFQENYSKAIEYYQLGLDSCKTGLALSDDPHDIYFIRCHIQIGLSECYLESGKLEQAKDQIKEVKETALTCKLKGVFSRVSLLEGTFLLKENKIEAFEQLAKQSLKYCTENALFNDKEKWLETIVELFERKGNYKEALSVYKRIIANKKNQESKTKAINFAQVLENKEIEILELENRNHEIQFQKEQLEQFAYIVAHDLKTPLSNISNFIGLFSSSYREKVDKKNQFYLDFVLDNTKHLHKMLDDLLRYINLKEVKGDIPLCDVQKLLVNLLENQIPEVNAKKAKVEFDVSSSVKMYPIHLERIFDNLIKNALKFSRNEELPHIRILVDEKEKEYLFEVADNGIGIEEQYHQKIFDVFKQLDKINYQGTGMGLSICKKIVNSYGGKIWVSGNQWGGVTFSFTIPKEISKETA